MTIDGYHSLNQPERFVATMFAYIPRALDNTAIGLLLERKLDLSRTEAKGVIQRLKARKAIIVSNQSVHKYRGNIRYSARDLAELLNEAEAHNWLPSKADLALALERTHEVSSGIKRCAMQAECARLLVNGSGKGMSDVAAKAVEDSRHPGVARGAAWHAAITLSDSPDFTHVDDTAPFLNLMRLWLNSCFLAGQDVRKPLVAIDSLCRSGAILDWRLIASYAALCFWTGWRQGLESALSAKADSLGSADAQKEIRFILSGCKLAMDGDFANADKDFRSAERLDDDLSRTHSGEESRQMDNLPERLLAAMCAAVAKPDKISKARPAKVMRRTWSAPGYWHSSITAEELYTENISAYSEWFDAVWKVVMSGKGEVISHYSTKPNPLLISGIIAAWDYRLLTSSRAALRGKVGTLLEMAKLAERKGYSNVARLYLTLLKGGYDKSEVSDILQRISSSTVAFLPETGDDFEWKQLLAVMRKAVMSADRAAKRDESEKSSGVHWYLTLAKSQEDAADLLDVDAYLHEEGVQDRRVELRWELEKKSLRRAFTEKDMAIARVLASNAHYVSDKVREEILPMFIGMDNVFAQYTTGERYYCDNTSDPLPVKVVAGKCEMKSSVAADGGIVLSVPKWAVSARSNVAIGTVDDETLVVLQFTDGIRKLLDMFRDLGNDGRIAIPSAAMKDASPLLERIASILPVAAPTEAEKRELRRIAAATALSAQLAFTGDALSAHIVVKPLPTMPALSVEPGEGHAEKVVADASGSFLLVRDIAAEKSKLDGVRKALADFETWHDGRSSWQVDDISAALGALSALKSFADARSGDLTLEWIDDRKVSITSAPKSGVRLGSTRTAEDWFSVNGEFALDDGRVLSIAKMIDAARTRVGDFVKLSDGDYIRLTKAMARQIGALAAASRRKGDGVEVPKAAIPMLDGAFDEGEDSLEMPDAMAKTAEEIRAEFARKPSVPKALSAELRPYQLKGFRWLSRLAGCGFGACLADDMGLGKTVQAIALLLDRAKDGPSLVVAPSSVCGNWRMEICRFAPPLKPRMAYDADADLKSFGPSDVVVASYGYLLFHEDEFASVTWNGVVLDEAQAVKNDASKRARAVKRLKAKFRVAATGTPVENRLGELWSIFDFLNPGLLGTATSFASRFTRDGMANGELKRLVKPLILRRLKGDVLDDLPEKTETTVMIELGKAERTAYEGCRVHAIQSLEATAAEGGGEPNRMSILAELTRLRRFCCHPSLVLPNEGLPSAKMEALVDLLANLREGRHRALVFSQFTDYLAIVRKALDARSWSYLYLDGSTPTSERSRLVEAFQSGEGDFFVISLKAGGTGLNLTAADYVILLDPWWNPAVENQAADRVHRIGQKHPVTVYRLIAADTVEERVLELHKEKRQIAEDVLDGTGSASLSPAQLMGLFRSSGQ